jgi:hypothetical protein
MVARIGHFLQKFGTKRKSRESTVILFRPLAFGPNGVNTAKGLFAAFL